MPSMELFAHNGHRNIMLEDFGHGLAVQANAHMVVHGNEAILLDPGGHKVYSKLRSEVASVLRGTAQLTDLFISHQDPDICAALNGWLMTTDAKAHVPTMWVRFITHFGVDSLVQDRIDEIPDEGRWIELGGAPLCILPAHYLHSCGNFNIWDPTSKILYSGDLGASLGMDYDLVEDFEAHVKYMEGFHRRYMASTAPLRAWTKMVRTLGVETIAPQHGALFKGPELSNRFLDWLDTLEVGADFHTTINKLPARG